MLPLALAVARKGGAAEFTCSELTEHASTNMQVIEQFLPVRFQAEAGQGMWHVRVGTIDLTP